MLGLFEIKYNYLIMFNYTIDSWPRHLMKGTLIKKVEARMMIINFLSP